MTDDERTWLERAAERGYTVPTWPAEYGGGGLSQDENLILLEEMRRIGARAPVAGMGTAMLGPTLLEYGTEEQKKRHIPRIARGEVWWCQGYSEPSSGSDLASLRTRAEDQGDHFLVNGQKIWTSGAQFADWIFCLVRTDPDVPKHQGISFLLFSMNQPGVTVKPIRLISGASPFCETFFDNAVAQKDDLLGEPNRGWTIAKRLLQHERAGIQSLASGRHPRERPGPAGHGACLRRRARRADRRPDTAPRHRPTSHGLPRLRPDPAARGAGSRGRQHARCGHLDLQVLRRNLGKRNSELQVSMMGTSAGDAGLYSGETEAEIRRAWLAGRRPPSPAAATRCSSTSSRSGCWGCRTSAPRILSDVALR